jgi:hypothetical protein
MWLANTLGNRTSALADGSPALPQKMAVARQTVRKAFDIRIFFIGGWNVPPGCQAVDMPAYANIAISIIHKKSLQKPGLGSESHAGDMGYARVLNLFFCRCKDWR